MGESASGRSKITGNDGSTLRISSVVRDDKGMYQCFAKNDYEMVQATAELRLGGESLFQPSESDSFLDPLNESQSIKICEYQFPSIIISSSRKSCFTLLVTSRNHFESLLGPSEKVLEAQRVNSKPFLCSPVFL